MYTKGAYSSPHHSFVMYNCFGVDPQADFDARPITFTQFNLPFIDKQTGGSCVLTLSIP